IVAYRVYLNLFSPQLDLPLFYQAHELTPSFGLKLEHVEFAKIVPPTSQNQARIEADLRLLLSQIHTQSDGSIAQACERLVRTYDPCISCSTHFLKVKIDRQ
ncbi:MAG: hypothetical protein ACKOAH_09225, partial [Pirellula sp.]